MNIQKKNTLIDAGNDIKKRAILSFVVVFVKFNFRALCISLISMLKKIMCTSQSQT